MTGNVKGLSEHAAGATTAALKTEQGGQQSSPKDDELFALHTHYFTAFSRSSLRLNFGLWEQGFMCAAPQRITKY